MLSNLKKIPFIMAENVFLSCILLFALAVIIGFSFFITYNLIEFEEEFEEIPSFNYELYKKIHNKQEEEKELRLKIEKKDYPNLFLEEKVD